MHDVEEHGMDRGGLSLAGIIASSFMIYEAKDTLEYTWLDMYFSVRAASLASVSSFGSSSSLLR